MISYSHARPGADPFALDARIAASPGAKAVHITVVHRECCGDKYCIVNFNVGSIFRRAFPRLRRLQACRRAAPYPQLRSPFSFGEMGVLSKAVFTRVTTSSPPDDRPRPRHGSFPKIAVVLRRNVGRDQVPFPGRGAVGPVQQNMRQFAHGFGGLRTKTNDAAEPGRSSGIVICAIVLLQRLTGSAGR